jgi:hypothetical protein
MYFHYKHEEAENFGKKTEIIKLMNKFKKNND